MKKAYSLMEMIIAIVIIGIIGSVLSYALVDIFKNYNTSKEITKLQTNTMNTLNQVENYFKRSISGSFIAYDNTDVNNANSSAFYTPINSSMTLQNLSNTNMLMWIDKDIENLKYGSVVSVTDDPVAPSTINFIQPNYNEWINLLSNLSTVNNQNGFETTATLANFTNIKTNIDNVFGVSVNPAIYFIYGNQIGTVYDRFWRTNTANTMSPYNVNELPLSIFAIDMSVSTPEEITSNSFYTIFRNNTEIAEVGELFDLSYTAYALRLDTNTKELKLIYNFQPWVNKNVNDAIDNNMETVLMDSVESFSYWVDNNLLRIQICIKNNNIVEEEDINPLICKERTFGVL